MYINAKLTLMKKGGKRKGGKGLYDAYDAQSVTILAYYLIIG
jgi:hypothetical protein